jgi:hypothetical protein
MKIKHVKNGFRIQAISNGNVSFFVALVGDNGSTWGGVVEGKIFATAQEARYTFKELVARGVPLSVDCIEDGTQREQRVKEQQKSDRNKFRARLCRKQERLKHKIAKETIAVRRNTSLGMPLPPNRIYEEPDREPVDKLAASMFWGAKKS